jgi:hypothetical protein
MSNETQNQNQNSAKSLLAQVRDEAARAKREAAKAQLKQLYGDYNKAIEVVEGIEAKIVELLKSVGEDEAAIRSLLTD